MEAMTHEDRQADLEGGGPIGTGALDPDRLVFSYVRDSDTLMVHFYGRGVPGVSVRQGDGWYVQWDRERTRPIGVQVEGFLTRVVRGNPDLLRALDIAELRGITPEEVAKVRREVTRGDLRRDPGAGILRLFPRLRQATAEGTGGDEGRLDVG